MKTVNITSHNFAIQGGQTLSFSHGLLARKDSISLRSIRAAVLYRNLLLVHHDGGAIYFHGPFEDRHRPLFETLKDLPDARFEEVDSKLKLKPENPLAAKIFYVVATLAIAFAIFFISLGDQETQPLTIVFYLLPAFCIAYLAKQGFFAATDSLSDVITVLRDRARRK